MKLGLIGHVHRVYGDASATGWNGLTLKTPDGRNIDIRGELPDMWREHIAQLKEGDALILELRKR